MNKLIYNKPAKRWREALPVGNGFTGVMIYGGKSCEKLCFNDSTLWSGYPKNQNNPDSLKYLDKVRELVFEGRNKEADALCMDKLNGGFSESYMPLGNILLRFSKRKYDSYKRELDIGSAIHTVSLGSSKRECFSSYPNRVTVYRIESNNPFSLLITAESRLHSEVITDGELNLLGNAPDFVVPNYIRTELKPVKYNEGKGMCFCLRCEAETDGKKTCRGKNIEIADAKTVTLYIATATGFKSFNEMPETKRDYALSECKRILKNAGNDYVKLKETHINDYKAIYERQCVSLSEESNDFTDAVIADARKNGVSPALCELFYNYGKYLMISGSRKDGQALNLQGIWNKSVRPPWGSNYTLNINTEMNYWGMAKSNLSSCAEPYVRFVYNIMKNGKETAKVNYGCRGFCCNHNADIWCKTSPVKGNPSYMYSPLCGAWLANELYAQLKTGGMDEYRDTIHEIITEATLFINDYLVFHDGYYVTAPSASPEAEFNTDGKAAALDYGSQFEMGIARQTFKNYLEFSSDELSSEIKEKLSLLYPEKAGDDGIFEWHDERQITDKGHRHFSPLYGFYPSSLIGYYGEREKTDSVKKLFESRINNSKQYIGWSAAWAICLAGRLHDRNKAEMVVDKLLGHAIFNNLFCVHPPFLFQIDGNFGFIAGVNELLIYEEDGIIDILPALPLSWKKGEVRGMVVNGAELSFKWENGLVQSISSNKKIYVRNLNLSDNVVCSENVVVKNIYKGDFNE